MEVRKPNTKSESPLEVRRSSWEARRKVASAAPASSTSTKLQKAGTMTKRTIPGASQFRRN
ncbi:unnamed protein product [Linum tenue]|uniref:Uncharacterized protein n=1 Tax=Linum tenue TaxID=586396 RepID=A0AAV0J0T3_9ROSI|nr:unnamed protein product [Linum tenue]